MLSRAILVAALAVPTGAAAQQPSPLAMRLERVSDRVAVISGYANGNILVVLGTDGAFIVDGQSERRVALADSVLRTFTQLPVRTVVNTHYHGDHTEGNAHWKARGARVLAHANVAVQAARDTTIPEMEWDRNPLPAGAMPDSTFRDSLQLTVGGDVVRVIHIPPAHTDGDAIIWLPRSDLIHTGDLVETEAFPFIDWWAGGSLDGMVAAIDLLLARGGPATRYVPGHGPIVDRAFLVTQRDMLVTMGRRIRDAIAAGQTLEQVQAARPTADYETRLRFSARSGAQFTKVLYLGLSRR